MKKLCVFLCLILMALTSAVLAQDETFQLTIMHTNDTHAGHQPQGDVLMPTMDPGALAEIRALEEAEDYQNPRYMQLLMEHHYEDHILRLPADEWPEPVTRSFARMNHVIYMAMQGPSELGVRGKVANWDRTAELRDIRVPKLVIGARYDTMDPQHMEWMAGALPNGRYLYCPNGSHLAMYDDMATYLAG